MALKHPTKYGTLTITVHDSKGKLEGFNSINTSVENNKFCQGMRDAEASTVCKKCFAATMEKRYNALNTNNKNNTIILSENALSLADMPFINSSYFRLHGTGELVNRLHLNNFVTLCKANPNTTFSLWTKRVTIVNRVFREVDKPSNLILIYSSHNLNEEKKVVPKYFDKVFTVYKDKETEGINCGGNKCKDCLLCYTNNNVTHIRELLK